MTSPNTGPKTPATTAPAEPQYETLKGCLLISVIMLISGALIGVAAYWFGNF